MFEISKAAIVLARAYFANSVQAPCLASSASTKSDDVDKIQQVKLWGYADEMYIERITICYRD